MLTQQPHAYSGKLRTSGYVHTAIYSRYGAYRSAEVLTSVNTKYSRLGDSAFILFQI